MELFKHPDSPYWWDCYTINGKQVRFSTKRPHKDKKGTDQILADRYQSAMAAIQFGTKEEIPQEEAFDQALHRVRWNTGTWKSYDFVTRQTLGLGSYDLRK